MTETITFLHAADLHIDSPFKGFSRVSNNIFNTLKNSTFTAFDRLIDTAIEKRVDFVLIVGDLFDDEYQSLKAQLHVKKGFERLQQAQIEVFLTYGNHDYIAGHTYPIDYPPNVHTFTEEEVSHITFSKANRDLANIYGFSYVNRNITENKAIQFSVTKKAVPFHIAMLHGTLHGNKEHDPYAPFRLGDLNREPFDYWALGHIHKRQIVQSSPPVVYPGNIQGRHRNEMGEKGCYYVKMNRLKTTLQFIPLQTVTIVSKQIDVTKLTTITEMKHKIVNMLESKGHAHHLYAISFLGNEEQNEVLGLKERLADLITLINDQFSEQKLWQFIFSYNFTLVDKKIEHVDPLFKKVIDELVDEINVNQVLEELYDDSRIRKQLYFHDEEHIKQDAYKLLIDELSKKAR